MATSDEARTNKPPVARSTRLSPAGSRLSEKVMITNQRLREIQREEEEALLELLRENEALTRNTVLTEMEIRRHKRLRETLDTNRAKYERELRRLAAERDKLADTRREEEQELQRLREEWTTLKGEVASLLKQKEELLRLHGELQNEVDRLHDQNDRLHEDIEQLESLKGECLNSIAKHKEARAQEMRGELPT